MRSDKVWLAFLLVMGCAVLGLPQPLSAPPYVLVVPFDTPISFAIWDPVQAQLQELSFLLVCLPSHGVLLGMPPELVYIPNPGFSGTDWVAFVVQNSLGQFDTAIVQIIVLGPGVTASPPAVGLSGKLKISGMPVTLALTTFEASYHQRFPFFDQEFRAIWGDAVFTAFTSKTKVEFIIPLVTPVRLAVTSTLAFDPTMLSLRSWTVDARTSVLGWDVSYLLYYDGADPQTSSYTELKLRGKVGDITAESRRKFRWLTLEFLEQTLTLSAPATAFGCPECDFRVEGMFSFTKHGFKELRIAALDIPIPCPTCQGFQILHDLRAKFTADEKKVEPALKIRLDWIACLRPLVDLLIPPVGFGLEGIEIYGMEIRCELAGGQGLRLATSFNPLKDATVTGDSRFFEVWQLYGPVLPCCGARGRWQVSTYFQRTTGYLFGWGLSEFILHFPLSDQVLVDLELKVGGVDVDPAVPGTQAWIITIGMKSLW